MYEKFGPNMKYMSSITLQKHKSNSVITLCKNLRTGSKSKTTKNWLKTVKKETKANSKRHYVSI